MIYVEVPETVHTRELSFYLAMEEYVASRLDAAEYFFMWQVEPSVIFGRNQLLKNEVNVDYCRRNNIRLYRRRSGGGCVYADRSNIMLSYVTAEQQVGMAFHRFVSMLLLVFRRMGINAAGTSHNDVLIGERKVSGTACYHVADRNIVHSTLLYDTDMTHMLNAITPSVEKLQSKGIQSVRQRITLLKDHVTMTLDEVKALIRETLCTDSCQLTDNDVAAIECIERQYQDEAFITRL
jgi:lipoic acid synthetase/lipoate-protein ligase A